MGGCASRDRQVMSAHDKEPDSTLAKPFACAKEQRDFTALYVGKENVGSFDATGREKRVEIM